MISSFFNRIFNTNKQKPIDWPDNIPWPLPKGVKIVNTLPSRYVKRDRSNRIINVSTTKPTKIQLAQKIFKYEKLSPVYVLSNGAHVCRDETFIHQQTQQLKQQFLEKYKIYDDSLKHPSKKYTSRFYSFSDKKLNQNTIKEVKHLNAIKPNGLWIGIGLNWYELGYYDHIFAGGYKYLYEIILKPDIIKFNGKNLEKQNWKKPNQKYILILKDKTDFNVFRKIYINKQFGQDFDYDDDWSFYLWKNVAKDFCGIINYVPSLIQGWDIKSGCIWNTKCIETFKLVAEQRS
jgi:hypothetical protein